MFATASMWYELTLRNSSKRPGGPGRLRVHPRRVSTPVTSGWRTALWPNGYKWVLEGLNFWSRWPRKAASTLDWIVYDAPGQPR